MKGFLPKMCRTEGIAGSELEMNLPSSFSTGMLSPSPWKESLGGRNYGPGSKTGVGFLNLKCSYST